MTVEDMYPEWPTLRCTDCGVTYVINELATFVVKGDCPTCGNERFNTWKPVPEGFVVNGFKVDA